MTELPILYSFRRCPYAMRARLAMQAGEQAWEHREVVLRDKPAAMLEASPKGTVPVLVLSSGEVIEESEDIMFWALGRNDPLGWLSPEEGSVDAMRTWILRTEEEFKGHLDRYKYADRYAGEDAQEHRQLAAVFLLELELRLARARCLFGERFSLGDAAIAPFVRQFANTDRAWFDSQPWPHLLAWLEEFLASTRFANIMAKYPPWSADLADLP